jgi:hypothetical protein
MGAPTGNSFWKNRLDMSNDGRKLSVEEVTEKIREYISRCTDERLYEVDFMGKAEPIEIHRPKMISMSIYGACVHLGIAHTTWIEWRKDKKYSEVLTCAEDIFKAYNIEGAGAGLLNQSIIARLESLKDTVDNTSSDGSMSPKQTINLEYQGKPISLSDD